MLFFFKKSTKLISNEEKEHKLPMSEMDKGISLQSQQILVGKGLY